MAHLTLIPLLVVYSVGAFVLTLFYLRYRRCSTLEVVTWGLLALMIPVFGPFFVIAARPGQRKRTRHII